MVARNDITKDRLVTKPYENERDKKEFDRIFKNFDKNKPSQFEKKGKTNGKS